ALVVVFASSGDLDGVPDRLPRRQMAEGDSEKIQGTWVEVTGEEDGENLSQEEYRGQRLVFKAGQLVVKSHGEKIPVKIVYRLGPAKDPKEIDLVYFNPSGEESAGLPEQVERCIYRLKGDLLKIGISKGGDVRPRGFSGRGAAEYVSVFKRVKAK